MYDKQLSSKKRVKMHFEHAKKELNLMEEAIRQGDFKEAMHHRTIADIATDEMINVSELLTES